MISLVLATYNRSDELRIFLDSVVGRTIQFEIIIVDQNDIINLEPLITEYKILGLDIVHIRIKEKNLSNARNVGVENAKYDLIGFPDDDCYYEDDTLTRILNFFKDKTTDILIGQWVEHNFRYTNFSKLINSKDIMSYNTCPLSSITIFASKSVLRSLNGFDIRLGVGQWFGAGEEIDLIMRATINHFNIYFSPYVKVHHIFTINSIETGVNRDKYLIRARGTGAIYSKNRISPIVIIRGLISPLFRCLFTFNHIKSINYLYMFWGRLTGFIVWKYKLEIA